MAGWIARSIVSEFSRLRTSRQHLRANMIPIGLTMAQDGATHRATQAWQLIQIPDSPDWPKMPDSDLPLS